MTRPHPGWMSAWSVIQSLKLSPGSMTEIFDCFITRWSWSALPTQVRWLMASRALDTGWTHSLQCELSGADFSLHLQCPKHTGLILFLSSFFKGSAGRSAALVVFSLRQQKHSEDDTGLNVTVGQQLPEATALTFSPSYLCLFSSKILRSHWKKTIPCLSQ